MLVELFSFQQRALERLRRQCAAAHNEYRQDQTPQVVAFTAPTGSGKTIIMSALIEDIFCGNGEYIEQPEAIFVWLSDSPELNEQSKDKIDAKADKIQLNKCIVVKDENFDQETFEEGNIYFLNTQKLSRSSNLTQHSDNRQYTIWETLANTIREKADHLYFIIDEAHRGMRGREAGKATTIMQKFILGSAKDGLPTVPVVIGMSATIQRFSQLVKDSSSTQRSIKISPDEVRASGLLKDRIIITYPPEANEQKDMTILAAATDEWVSKCQHWETYCREQHHWMVKPVFVVQVLNGSGEQLSATDLDECLTKIEERSGIKFETGEVVHAFGETRGKITIGGIEVPYEEPSKIQDNSRVRIVFFKETLSTGWDCPRAETMMSFRRYTDATAIAQLLGRMVRTPIQKHILVDDMLNDVRLFLPHFDADTVSNIVEELQNSEGGELPTDIYEDELERGTLTTLTSRPRKSRRKTDVQSGPSMFDADPAYNPQQATNSEKTSDDNENEDNKKTVSDNNKETNIDSSQDSDTKHIDVEYSTETEDTPIAAEFDFEYDGINRPKIVEFINELALPTYHIRTFTLNNPLRSLAYLTSFLSISSGLDINARTNMVDDIVEMIHQYITLLKSQGKYEVAKQDVLNFEMYSKVYDAFGEPIKQDAVRSLFSETAIDLERQLRVAEKRLEDQGISQAYGEKYNTTSDPAGYMADVIIFTSSEDCMNELATYAKHKYNELNDEYRSKTIKLSDSLRTKYRDIVRDSAEVSNIPFTLDENIAFRCEEKGEECSDHLFIDEQTGYAKIKLNTWEKGVIEEERKREDFRCWYRNPSRGSNALCLYYRYKGNIRGFYPDFIVIRKENGGDYLFDILEPHDPTRDDNVGKAQALAEYATQNPSVIRAQLIREAKTMAGNTYRRLDFAASTELRNRVASITTNQELDNLFEQYGS